MAVEAQVWFHAELELPLNHTGSRSLRSETGKQSPKDLGVLRQVTTLKARLMGWVSWGGEPMGVGQHTLTSQFLVHSKHANRIGRWP